MAGSFSQSLFNAEIKEFQQASFISVFVLSQFISSDLGIKVFIDCNCMAGFVMEEIPLR